MALTKAHKKIIEVEIRKAYTAQISKLSDHALFHMVKGLDARGNNVETKLENTNAETRYAFEVGVQIAVEVLETRGYELVEFNAILFHCEHL
jgi:hypothetical protein